MIFEKLFTDNDYILAWIDVSVGRRGCSNMTWQPCSDSDGGGRGVEASGALGALLAWCGAQTVGGPAGWHNRIYSCVRHPLDHDRTVYSDADMHAEVDGLPVLQ